MPRSSSPAMAGWATAALPRPLVLLRGEAGIGKSRLVEAAVLYQTELVQLLPHHPAEDDFEGATSCAILPQSCIDKRLVIAPLEGGAHLMLVLAALLVWRAPQQSRDVLWLMVFLNSVWALTDLVYIPLAHLTLLDFYAKLAVNAALAVGRRAGTL